MPGALHLQHPANAYQLSDIAHLGYSNPVSGYDRVILGMAGSIVLIIFGTVMILPIGQTDTLRFAADALDADYLTRFISIFVFLGISVC